MQKICMSYEFLILFCSELQKMQKTLFDLTRKGRVFHSRTEQQEAFDEIER